MEKNTEDIFDGFDSENNRDEVPLSDNNHSIIQNIAIQRPYSRPSPVIICICLYYPSRH